MSRQSALGGRDLIETVAASRVSGGSEWSILSLLCALLHSCGRRWVWEHEASGCRFFSHTDIELRSFRFLAADARVRRSFSVEAMFEQSAPLTRATPATPALDPPLPIRIAGRQQGTLPSADRHVSQTLGDRRRNPHPQRRRLPIFFSAIAAASHPISLRHIP